MLAETEGRRCLFGFRFSRTFLELVRVLPFTSGEREVFEALLERAELPPEHLTDDSAMIEKIKNQPYTCMPRSLERHFAVCTASAATAPDLVRESLANFLGCVVNDLAAVIVLTARVLERGLGVLGKRACGGIVLAGPLALSGARHGLPHLIKLFGENAESQST